ncbi:Glycosyltransferase, catalytic subunit of cellulose synthase and poly-beta-1,6-N-acetylglucosamine synthase [Curtobacterium sp. 9128]|uniref:glycosyltransferase family 2 protein n=1 Tax=Curtobacterium sp. 9128 TaxID=1793722 RepID=UPI0007D720D1|nr:glycosyltransferase family 2 protein [Curtobacterium sp. 9128]SBN61228.1 Glycosyltransferase, catalytic subunit of cellulose synthase and poly-beta-1,6-N-acetylglucosamine synthase [Curtobacterium sp. 9128]
MTTLVAIVNTVSVMVIALSLVYFLSAMIAGIHELRRVGSALRTQGDAVYRDPFADEPGTFDVYFLIPCLNEEAVIGQTVRALAGGRRSTTIVIDDGSEDGTAAIARREGGPDVMVLERTLPDARKGKGAALNAAFRLVLDHVAERDQDPERVLVCVMDADGRLSDAALSHILPLFEDPSVGGSQLAVRIRNRNENFLTRFQDFQFWSMSAVTQFGRRKTGTVSLGGNGQFTRLTALRELGSEPWSASLTEDLDLAISLIANGWRLETTPDASLDQQGVESLRRLVIQRRRWYQGHMTAGKRIGEVWSNPTISNARALEVSAYLAVPWLFDLPWSILWHWTLASLIMRADAQFAWATSIPSAIVGGLLWYLVTFAPAIFTTVVYHRRDRRVGWPTAVLMGHAFVVMNYLSFVCAWGALFRMARGRTGWDKTTRTADEPRTAPAPA